MVVSFIAFLSPGTISFRDFLVVEGIITKEESDAKEKHRGYKVLSPLSTNTWRLYIHAV